MGSAEHYVRRHEAAVMAGDLAVLMKDFDLGKRNFDLQLPAGQPG